LVVYQLLCMRVIDVQQEKQHNQLIQSVEGFSPDALRKTETVEKLVLPNAEGKTKVNLFPFESRRQSSPNSSSAKVVSQMISTMLCVC
jgi:hypothetical protein